MVKIDLNNAEIVFLDIETTSPKFDAEIIEIAGLITDNNLEIKDSFDFLIKPQNLEKADPKALELVGYNEEKWQNARDLKEVLTILYPKFKNKILAGWAIHFDSARLEKAFFENGFDDPFDYRRLDIFSIAVAKYGLKNLGGKETLTKICQVLGINRGKPHSAYDDAYASYKVFLKLISEENLKPFAQEIIVYTDGGALGNPGRAAIGVVIKLPGGVVKEYNQEIGIKTNNQAEYEAVIFALKKIKQLLGKDGIGQAKVILYLDSEVVGKQLRNEFKIHEENLFPYFIQFNNLKMEFYDIEINVIPREENKIADKLVKDLLFHKISTII